MELVSVLFLITVLTIGIVHYYFSRKYNYWKIKGIPYIPRAVPVLGHIGPMILLRENYPEMCKRLYNKSYNYSMVGFYHLITPALLIRDPELAKIILVTNFSNFNENQIKLDHNLDPLLSTHPFFNNGKLWKDSRVRVSNAFSTRKLKVLLNLTNDVCKKLKNYLNKKLNTDNHIEIELKDLFSKYTAEIVASAIFGIEGNSFSDEKKNNGKLFADYGNSIFSPTIINAIIQNMLFFLPKIAKIIKISLVPREMDTFLRSIMRDTLMRRRAEDFVRRDFLQLIIDQETINSHYIDENSLACYAASFFLDLYETTSITLSFLIYLMALNPTVQEKARDEVKRILGKFEYVICYEALQEMIYMEQALNESMRLYPAAGALMKICTEKFQLTGTDGVSCMIEPGTIVVIPTEAYHLDPLYWPNPEDFNPDRFSDNEKIKRNKFTFLPFGEGPRKCVAMRMAIMQMKAATAMILKDYRLEVSSRMKTPLKRNSKTLMATVEGGLWIQLRPLV